MFSSFPKWFWLCVVGGRFGVCRPPDRPAFPTLNCSGENFSTKPTYFLSGIRCIVAQRPEPNHVIVRYSVYLYEKLFLLHTQCQLRSGAMDRTALSLLKREYTTHLIAENPRLGPRINGCEQTAAAAVIAGDLPTGGWSCLHWRACSRSCSMCVLFGWGVL